MIKEIKKIGFWMLFLAMSLGASAQKNSFKKIKQKAEQGNAKAQYELGVMYYYGEGVLKKDEIKAVYWYQKAAKQGDADGQYELGYMYYYGNGVSKDYKKAAYWYKKAAKRRCRGSI